MGYPDHYKRERPHDKLYSTFKNNRHILGASRNRLGQFACSAEQAPVGEACRVSANYQCVADCAKGVGEVCSIPTTPVITNAIYNAVGVRVDRTPVDQELIARELWERESKK
jgi:hypothetical protein